MGQKGFTEVHRLQQIVTGVARTLNYQAVNKTILQRAPHSHQVGYQLIRLAVNHHIPSQPIKS